MAGVSAVLTLLSNAAWLHSNASTNGCALFRSSFTLPEAELTSAIVGIAGVGYGEVWINGKKADESAVLEPAWSQWNKRLLVPTYDVRGHLLSGQENVIGLVLGAGWYSHFGDQGLPEEAPSMKVSLLATDAEGVVANVSSSSSWTVGACPITFNDIYNGEAYDARLEDPSWCVAGGGKSWPPATANHVPPKYLEAAVLSTQEMPPIRAHQLLEPEIVTVTSNSTAVTAILDFGQNIAGWVSLFLQKCAAGTNVTVRHAEMLNDDRRSLYWSNLLLVNPVDSYVCNGAANVHHEPRFTFHGFRFAEIIVTGDVTVLWTQQRARVVHTAVQPRGQLEMKNAVLSKVHSAIKWTQLDNLFSIPSDCPQRDERFGWMGDAAVAAEMALNNFDMKVFYLEWLQTVVDTQETENYYGDCGHPFAAAATDCKGAVADTSPHFPGIYGQRPADPSWGVALPVITDLLSKHYGPETTAHLAPAVHAWADFLLTAKQSGLVTYHYYGDWLQPHKVFSDEIVSNMTSCFNALLALQVASQMGAPEDRSRFAKEFDTMRSTFLTTYWNNTVDSFGDGTQAPQIYALYLGGASADKQEKALSRLISLLMANGMQTGIVGTKWLYPVLSRYGRTDLGLMLASSTAFPSWGWMVAKGATTIWEHWGPYTDGSGPPDIMSHNHPALASVGGWFFTDLVGLRVDRQPMELGTTLDEYNELLPEASGSIATDFGVAQVSWQFRPHVVVTGHCPAPSCSVRVPLDGMDYNVAAPILKMKPGVRSVSPCGRSACASIGAGMFSIDLKAKVTELGGRVGDVMV